MKKLIYLIMVLGFVFTSCEPMDEIHAAIDAQENPIVGDANYVLSDDDYDALGLGYGSFSNLDDAKEELPALLAELYPTWGKGSSVLVGYDLYVGNAFSVEDYSLNQDDYTFSGSDLLGFESDATPSNYLADILTDNISNAYEGDYVVTKYFQFTGDAYTVTPIVSLEDNFDYGDVAGDLLTASSDNWANHSGTDNQLQYSTSNLTMEDYPSSNIGGSIAISGSDSEDVNSAFTTINSGKVYASTLVNISAVDDGNYFFHIMEAANTIPYAQFRSRVGAKDDGSGNILFGIGASSSTLTYGTTAFDLNTTYLLVSSYEIATGISNLYVLTTAETTEPETPEATNTGTSGNLISAVAIRQSGDIPTATLDGIRVANTWSAIMTNDELEDVVIGDKVGGEMSYMYADGSWATAPDRFYFVSDADFDSMGEESGQPGRYNNFGSSTPPDDYLPTFLSIKFPYALEGTELDVAYDYYSSSSGAQVRGNLYTVIDGEWVAYQSTISTTLQFGHDGANWVPDNTIKYTLTGADITLISGALEAAYPGPAGNVANYGSFDRREGGSNYWSDAMLVEAFNILLDNSDPSAEEGQKYAITFVVYTGATTDETMNLIKTGGVWVLNN